jgi:hypothetical protein
MTSRGVPTGTSPLLLVRLLRRNALGACFLLPVRQVTVQTQT